MTNVWMDVLIGRLAAYVSRSMEESEYFDFMVLLKRVLRNKTLMDFDLIISQAHDKATLDEEFDPAAFHENVMRKLLPRVAKAFDKLSIQVSVEDMRKSSYQLRAAEHYTFMEMYWIYMAWVAFGEDQVPTVAFMHDVIVVQGLASIRDLSDKHTPVFAMHAKKADLFGKRMKKDANQEMDLVQFMLQRIDHKLLQIKAGSAKSKQEADVEAIIFH